MCPAPTLQRAGWCKTWDGCLALRRRACTARLCAILLMVMDYTHTRKRAHAHAITLPMMTHGYSSPTCACGELHPSNSANHSWHARTLAVTITTSVSQFSRKRTGVFTISTDSGSVKPIHNQWSHVRTAIEFAGGAVRGGWVCIAERL